MRSRLHGQFDSVLCLLWSLKTRVVIQSRYLQATDALLVHVCLVYLTNANNSLSWGNWNSSFLSICSHYFVDFTFCIQPPAVPVCTYSVTYFSFLDYLWERMEIFRDSSFKSPSEREQQDRPRSTLTQANFHKGVQIFRFRLRGSVQTHFRAFGGVKVLLHGLKCNSLLSAQFGGG